MAEISEAPNQPEFDPETIRTTQPGLKRLILTFSVLITFLLGFPLLWKSVEIYRSPLPFNDVESLSNDVASYDHRQFPYNFHVILITSQALSHSLFPKINEIPLLSSNFTISVTVDPIDATSCTSFWLYPCGAIRAADFDFSDDEAVDESLRSILGSERVYSVVVVENAGVEETKAVVGKYRHGWIVAGEGKADEVVDRVAEMLEKVFVNGGKEKGVIHGEFMPVGADGRIVLSFNLLNSDPHDQVYDWDFQKIDETLLAPVIEALVPIASISVESQVLYHTPKSSLSSWDEKLGGYVFRMKDLPFFVNSNEWHLDTSIAAGGRSKILQFVIYIPSSKECPLLLQLPNGEITATNSFISPMWGGVMVWNPPNCLSNVESRLHAMHMMSFQDLQKIFEVFMGQFRQLFGLKSNSIYVGSTGAYKLLASKRGFTQWELDVLARQYTIFNLRSSATTLGSLSRLVQSLPRMIIMDDIGKQVGVSLEAAKLAQTNASLGVYDASAVSSRQARSLAEDAFFHPSIMSVSYYSFEHCFAVYSPFFLPVSMHVLLAAIREWRRYKHENAKYLRWKATLNLAS